MMAGYRFRPGGAFEPRNFVAYPEAAGSHG